jgi:copper chaperone
MENLTFKTTINCNGCLSKVSPQLNDVNGIEEWSVDLENPEKILTVNTSSASEEDILNAVKKVGFKIERVK